MKTDDHSNAGFKKMAYRGLGIEVPHWDQGQMRSLGDNFTKYTTKIYSTK